MGDLSMRLLYVLSCMQSTITQETLRTKLLVRRGQIPVGPTPVVVAGAILCASSVHFFHAPGVSQWHPHQCKLHTHTHGTGEREERNEDADARLARRHVLCRL